ncbi:TatD family hydrolase [Synechococcus sp. PCC 6717]|jgi:TatD DNase family protein|uniref:D-aminoacyl-tRNA deacylase n=1 Tax=Parathermosynechococcus lividus PCC 6715 TaxID=1917166 RepID=A0A2D2Q3D3_PARLV|nr:TatD family hydrolase [Thermostichus lividus]ATS19020.1 deoxyribonuclease [Thermostichus lividus PCC 6715]MCH9055958.1 TatD family hydrolase [Synechococcus sp. PCC 6716]MCI3279629.1 TatD family hydrolase [Synechococcus sp. PCC 6717]
MLVDTHVHLNFANFAADLETVAQRWREAGVVRLVHSCVEPTEFTDIQALTVKFPELFMAVGLHPLDTDQWHPDLASTIASLAASDPKVVAIGETGLDFYKANNQSQQEEAFWAQLAVAHSLSLPVIIHCREAAAATRNVLQQFQRQYGSLQGVMHCWGGTPEETEWFLELGLYISFSGTVTFKNAKQIQAAAQMVPGDRLLIETDCPFLAPVPKRGEKRNEPSYVRFVASAIAALRQCDVAELGVQTTINACRLFRLPPPEMLETQAGRVDP